MKTLNFNNKCQYNEVICINSEEIGVLREVCNYCLNYKPTDSRWDPFSAQERREAKIALNFLNSKQDEPTILAIVTELPLLINGQETWRLYPKRFDLNEANTTIFNQYINKVKKARSRIDKLGLRIPNDRFDNPGWRSTEPVIYDILSQSSVVKHTLSEYYHIWYPTITELNLLLKELNELLQNPLESYHTWVLRKNAVKLLMRLTK